MAKVRKLTVRNGEENFTFMLGIKKIIQIVITELLFVVCLLNYFGGLNSFIYFLSVPAASNLIADRRSVRCVRVMCIVLNATRRRFFNVLKDNAGARRLHSGLDSAMVSFRAPWSRCGSAVIILQVIIKCSIIYLE